MALTGKTFSAGVATSPEGWTLPYRILSPSRTKENLHTLGVQAMAWRGFAKQMKETVGTQRPPSAVRERIDFAELVLGTAAENLRLGLSEQLLAEDKYGDIRGVLVYWLDTSGKTSISALTIDARLMLEVPGYTKYRGVGTAMVAVLSRIALRNNQQAIYLHPLDHVAKGFWLARGFRECPPGSDTLCVQGKAGIEALIDGCYRQPEKFGGEEYLLCGLRSGGRVTTAPLIAPASPLYSRT